MGRKLITKEELAKHDTEKDGWLCIHGFVVSITNQLKDEHPGGPEVIFNLAGTDATEDFEDMGHSDAAREWADRSIIGYIEGREDLADETKRIPRIKEINATKDSGLVRKLAPIVVVALLAMGLYLCLK